MSDPIIKVENLSKKYIIGHQKQERYIALRDALTNKVKNLVRRFPRSFTFHHSPFTDSLHEEFWALKDVSFEVKQGDGVGIIGRNGAGKTTLLKILSRITEPTAGRVSIKGRVASLLEVGTGFHPELTGRENIYLNGAILGMSKAEIKNKFDAIVAFAETEKFLDTPVKRYSSGMYVRLAFAVAAHLEPEILIVDEVLAVGDVQFQKKCLGKMEEVGKEGRTVLFVSHNMGVIANLCPEAILLDRGNIVSAGTTNEVVCKYTCTLQELGGQLLWADQSMAPGTSRVRLKAVRIISDGSVTSEVMSDKEVKIQIDFWNFEHGAMLGASIHLLDSMGSCIFATGNGTCANLIHDDWSDKLYPVGLFRSTCVIPANFLNDSTYLINAFITRNIGTVEAGTPEALPFAVIDSGTMRGGFTGHWRGIIRPKMAWSTEQLS
ncbi:MAG: ABC transporter ATP-binding protein [Planctomycetes bacterium]|nr:ABC transporter ATP-binding protein [Planctomycetota bacterium]